MTITERAFAKINLGLKVLRRRPDGYHDILTLMQTIDLCDTLEFRPADGISLECDTPGIPCGDDNLICKAIVALRAETGAGKGVDVTLAKRIPVGAGLGGGSADAAAALRGANRLWGAGLSGDELSRIGATVGSDVPFLVSPGTAVVSGRGDEVRYLSWGGDCAYLLVYPGIRVSTSWAYSAIDAERAGKNDLTNESEYGKMLNSVGVVKDRLLPSLVCALGNDFEGLVEDRHPVIGRIRARLLGLGAVAALLSGSGSVVYGIFRDEHAAARACQGFDDCGWELFVARPYCPGRAYS